MASLPVRLLRPPRYPPLPPAPTPPTAPPAPGSQLRQALSAKDPAAQAKLIRGLRDLKDPALAPLFAQLGNSKSTPLRAEAILGLADLSPDKGLDLLPVRKLDPMGQAAVLSEAITRGLLKTEQLEDLARWPDLQPGLYVSVAGRLVAAKKRIDPVRLRQIAVSEDPIVSTIAAILLTQMGAGAKDVTANATGERILTSKAKGASEAARRILGVIRERKLAAGTAFCQRAIELAGSDRLLRFEAVATLLVIEPSGERAAQLLSAEMAVAPDVADRTRLALAAASAALERDAGLPASAVQILKKDRDSLIAALGGAMEALLNKTGATSAFATLIATRSGPALAWAVHACEKLPPEDAKVTRLALVAAALQGDDRGVEAAASDAAHAIAMTDPAALVEPLRGALEKHDEKTSGRILAAAMRADNPKAAVLAGVGHSTLEKDKPGPTWPSTAVESIATLLRARHATTFTPTDIEQLTRIAMGSGGLPEASKVQAAWIALKASTDDQAALSRILADLTP